MPSLRSSWIPLDLGLQGATTAVKEVAVPVAGVVKEVWVGAQVLATTGTCAVAKGTINLLTATNVNLASDIAAGVAASQTLATAATTLRVAAGNIIVATWTINTAGSFTGGACLVWIEPDIW